MIAITSKEKIQTKLTFLIVFALVSMEIIKKNQKSRKNSFNGLKRMEETFPGEKPRIPMPSGSRRSCFSRPR